MTINLFKTESGLNAVGNSTIVGDLTVTGNLVVSGTSVSSGSSVGNFLPDTDGRNLGNTTFRWNLFGLTVNAATALISGGPLTVAGNTTLSGTLNQIFGNSNFDSGVLFVDSVNNRVGINNTTPSVVLQVTGTANITGNTAVGGTFGATGNTTLSGLLTVSGNVAVDTNVLFVDIVNNRVGINNSAPTESLTVTGTTNISGNSTIGGNLIVTGNATIAGITYNSSGVGSLPQLVIGNTGYFSNTYVFTPSSNTSLYVADSFSVNTYKAAKYTIFVRDANTSPNYTMTEILLYHDGTNVFLSEYGTMYNNRHMTFDADISANNVRLLTNSSSTSAVTVVVARQTFA